MFSKTAHNWKWISKVSSPHLAMFPNLPSLGLCNWEASEVLWTANTDLKPHWVQKQTLLTDLEVVSGDLLFPVKKWMVLLELHVSVFTTNTHQPWLSPYPNAEFLSWTSNHQIVDLQRGGSNLELDRISAF